MRSADGRALQVKARLVVPGKKGTQQYSPFRSWHFDACIFVTFDAFTYDVLEALEVLPEAIRSLAEPVPHVGASAMRGAYQVTALGDGRRRGCHSPTASRIRGPRLVRACRGVAAGGPISRDDESWP